MTTPTNGMPGGRVPGAANDHEPCVRVQKEGAIAIVALSRPRAMNAVNTQLRNELIATLYELNADTGVRAVVLTGAGPRAFCAGQDLEESRQVEIRGIHAWLNHQRAMYQAMRDLDKPCVAALNGVAAGAGFQLALVSDIRVGYPELKLGQPEVRAGLASIVGSYLMTLHVGLSQNLQMSLTGELMSGERAAQLGLINYLVEKEQVVAKAIEVAESLAALPPTAVRLTKERFRRLTQAGFDDACDTGIRYQLECYASGEPQAAQAAFLASRAAGAASHQTS